MTNFDWHPYSLPARRTLAKISRMTALPFCALGLLMAEVPLQPAHAAYYNPPPYRASTRDYERCTASLLGNGLQVGDATAACAGALYPTALAACVTDIAGADLTASDALSGCRRVRRPQELATCVGGIDRVKTEGTKSLDVLDYCRRSLQPARFSNCVVGLSGAASATSTTEVMTTCIAASIRPRQVLPDFIPSGQPVPLQPLPGGDTSSSTTAPLSSPSMSSPQTQTAPSSAPSTNPLRSTVPGLW
jgi:hypothetical protein